MYKDYKFIDCTEKYHSVMQFDKNKNVFVHRWYPFVEGYSKEFIEDILRELPFTPTCALEPFCGSGTTPVELQNHGIKCYSFEVSPFMHLLSTVKLGRKYNVDIFTHYVKAITKKLSHTSRNIRKIETLPFGNTIVKSEQSKKWNFHDTAIDGILDIRHAIRTIVDDDDYDFEASYNTQEEALDAMKKILRDPKVQADSEIGGCHSIFIADEDEWDEDPEMYYNTYGYEPFEVVDEIKK